MFLDPVLMNKCEVERLVWGSEWSDAFITRKDGGEGLILQQKTGRFDRWETSPKVMAQTV